MEFLTPLKKYLDENAEVAISYIKMYYGELLNKIDSIKDKKTREQLMSIILSLSGKEVEELIRCINDIKSWPYKGAYGIELYIERSFLYLNGGNSRYDGEDFLGFKSNFKDEELVTTLLNAPQVRKLMTYRKELEFFSEARYSIKKSVETEGKWEEFYEFYNKLDENIKKVRNVYGNEQFAKILETFKEKKHEAPIDWENELYRLYEDLIKKAYQFVVEPASESLIKIFEARIQTLNIKKQNSLKELVKLLNKQASQSNSRKKFLKVLARTRKELIAKMKDEKTEFESLLQKVLPKIHQLNLELQTFVERTDVMPYVSRLKDIFELYTRWSSFSMSQVKLLSKSETMLENDATPKAINRAIAAMQAKSNAALQEQQIRTRVLKAHLNGYRLLVKLATVYQKEVVPSIQKCEAYIETRLDYYTKEVANYLEQNEALELFAKQQANENLM